MIIFRQGSSKLLSSGPGNQVCSSPRAFRLLNKTGLVLCYAKVFADYPVGTVPLVTK